MAFTGAWRNGAQYQNDARVVHVADPAHMESGTEDTSVQASTYHLPPQIDPGPVGEYPGMEFVVEYGGTVIDTTDTRSHERNDADQGAARAGVFSAAPAHQVDHTYTIDRFESPGAPGINPVALVRGRNGLPENNPEGFRAGVDSNYFENRKFPVGERVHESRIIFPDLPDPGNTAGPVGGAYPTSFAALARNITNVNQTPSNRREPPTLGGDLVDDASPYYPSVVGDLGVIG